MIKARLKAIAHGVEAQLAATTRFEPVRRTLERAALVLDRVLTPASDDQSFYGASYFAGAGHEGKRSGYDSYTRDTSHADALVSVLLQSVDARNALDVGCARGFVVEALRDVGIDASGCDFSAYAINTASRGARGHLRWGDLSARLPYDSGAFELVTCFETLEHLPPALAPRAVQELARLSSRYVVASIPSFGPRPPLPAGWFAGKVRHDGTYEAMGPEYDGPIPDDGLALDSRGQPLEGHLTIASFRWWRRHFEAAGLVHCQEAETALYEALKAFNLHGFFDFYVFRHPGAEAPRASSQRLERARAVLRPKTAKRSA
jgi:SAM-dependent methyltransferase